MKRFAALSIGIGVAAVGLAPGTAGAAHNTPSKAQQYVMPLVRDYPECTAPNDTKPPPVGLLGAVCSTPGEHAATSAWKVGPKGLGSLTLKWVSKNTKDYNAPAGPDSPTDADVMITTKVVDWRTPANIPYTGPAAGGGIAKLRITDTYTGSGNSGTQQDIIFPIPAPPGQGCSNGKCTIVTSADGAFPGAVQTGKKANIQVGVGKPGAYPTFDPWVKVNAPDGEVFATPGLYLP